jgi:hypothetical protein
MTLIRAHLIFSGSGPILTLSTYPQLTDDRLLAKLRYKGIERFLAYEVDLASVRDSYGQAFEAVAADLGPADDFRILDFNGHQIMSNFALEKLGSPIKHSGGPA